MSTAPNAPFQALTVHVLIPEGQDLPAVNDALALLQSVGGPVQYRAHAWVFPPASVTGYRLQQGSESVGIAEDPGGASTQNVEHLEIWQEMNSSMVWQMPYDPDYPHKHRKGTGAHEFRDGRDAYEWLDLRSNPQMGQLAHAVNEVVKDFYASTGASRENSLVVPILTAPNPLNLFAVPDLFGWGWGFVQANHAVTGLMAAPHLPIAYEILSMPLRQRAFPSLDVFLEYLHVNDSVGCMNDMYQNLREMERKLRSADICTTCMERIRRAHVPYALLRQTRDGMERIRSFQLNLSNLLNDFERPQLFLEYTLRVENIGKVIPLAPKELAVYALFAEFPDGLPLTHVPDHLDRLMAWYRRFYTGSGEDPQQIVQVARRLAFNEDNDLSQNVSRLNRRIRKVLEHLGDPLPYTIQGPNGGPKGIPAVAEGLVRVVSRPV
jgi:hypothetical protein